jgi:hypothetical protein
MINKNSDDLLMSGLSLEALAKWEANLWRSAVA